MAKIYFGSTWKLTRIKFYLALMPQPIAFTS